MQFKIFKAVVVRICEGQRSDRGDGVMVNIKKCERGGEGDVRYRLEIVAV